MVSSAPFPGTFPAARLIAEAARSVFTVQATPSIDAFANEHYRLTSGEMQGAWNSDNAPYARGIFEALQDPMVSRVTLLKAAQLGGTAIVHAWLMWMICHDPSDTLLVMPSTEKVRDLKQTRLGPTIRACEAVKGKLLGSNEELEGLTLKFARMNLQLLGSNSKSRIEGHPYRHVLVDEVDRCVPEIMEVVAERVKTFAKSKILALGTPGYADVGIHREWTLGTQERWHVPCPHAECGAYHARQWRMVQWEGGKDASPEDVADGAWMRCPHCRKKIEAHHNRGQQKRGVWVPKGCGVRHDGTIVVPAGVRLTVQHRSFALHGLDNALVPNPYGKVAAPFVAAGCKRTMVWTTDTVGEPWRPAAMKVEVAQLKERCAASTHQRGRLPADVIALAAGCDVQTDRMYGLIVGFAPGGERVYLINWAELPLDHGAKDPLVALNRWIDERRWLKDASTLPVIAEFVDSGDSTDMVYRSCRMRGVTRTKSGMLPRRQPVKGSAQIQSPWKKSILDQTSKAGGAGLELLHVNSGYWTENILTELGLGGTEMEEEETERQRDEETKCENIKDAMPSTSELRNFGTSRLILPRDADEELLEHFVNEQAQVVIRGGQRKRIWVLSTPDAKNHWMDALKYAWAGADARGIRNTLRVGAASKPAAAQGSATDTARDNPAVTTLPRTQAENPLAYLTRLKG